ncbi:2-oxo acid dehydrogenase subunit E2 [Grimontia sp. S25]|uniref:Dihydrolipoamide acetyltransferase component of pyruvate dehydrogenase complex n=1 Tax=Grimontia sedimenti TaxID=2711294 RepID=A0A6M1R2Z0_9GAMM|nr:2-oxo acid dehydrogenase subunit E2 [Grimontia sedimenti]NGN96643.1 2-oxo acid dehydrogenase subunit E2 [Grimontia sedimenti]
MDIIMPQLGETVAEGEILAWHKAEGDKVKKGDVLFEISTDKVAMEVPAMEEGELTKIIAQVGEVIAVGEPVGEMAVEGEVANPKSTEPASIIDQQVSASADVNKPATEPSSFSKTGHGPLSPAVKYLSREHALDLDEIDGTGSNGRITKRDVQAYLAQQNVGEVPAVDEEALALMSPSVRRLVTEHDVDVSQIQGSGKHGRITKEDVLDYLDNGGKVASQPVTASPPAKAEPQPVSITGEEVAFSFMRKQIARQMSSSKDNAVHVAQGMEISFDEVEAVRQQHKAEFKQKYGASLTPLAFIARAVVKALQAFPHLNGQVSGEKLVVSAPVHLGIAVDLNHKGLVVPVIKDADTMNVSGLARKIAELAKKARENRLTPDEMSGATYTLSNNGGAGTAFTTPIINHPEIAILSIDSISRKPVVVNMNGRESLGIGSVGMVVQSFDHRAVDGAYSGAFLQRVKSLLESHGWQAEL